MDYDKKIVLVSIGRDKDGLFGSRRSSATERVIKRLQAEKRIYEFFEVDHLSSLDNTVKHLFLRGDSQFLVFVNERNRNIINALASRMIEFDRDCCIEYEPDEDEGVPDDMQAYNMTFARGYYMSLVGNYPLAGLDGTVKHIKTEEGFAKEKIFDKITGLCNVNSSICTECDEDRDMQQIQSSQDNIKQYLDDNRLLPINLVYSDKEKIIINGNTVKGFKRFVKIPYHKRKECRVAKDEQLLYELETEEDIAMLKEDLEYYHRTNTVFGSPFWEGQIRMICRFLSEQECTVRKLPQISINKDGNVFPCDQKRLKIGNIERSSLSEMKNKCAVIDETEKSRRNCGSCDCRDICSKCSFMSGFLRNGFCDLKRNYPYISALYYETNLVKDLKGKFKVFAEIPLEEIKISNIYFQNITDVRYEGKKETKCLFCPYVCVVHGRDVYTIWSPLTGKVFRISREYALVAEYIFGKIPQKNFADLLDSELGYGKEDSSYIAGSSMELFEKAGLFR